MIVTAEWFRSYLEASRAPGRSTRSHYEQHPEIFGGNSPRSERPFGSLISASYNATMEARSATLSKKRGDSTTLENDLCMAVVSDNHAELCSTASVANHLALALDE